MDDVRDFTVDENEKDIRVDKFLAGKVVGFSREALKAAFLARHVSVNDKPAKASLRLKAGDSVRVELPDEQVLQVLAEDIPLNIVYEDAHVCVVDKPQGLCVHPAPGTPDHTLVNALLYHVKDLSSINGVIRPGIVHRIDKDTSGLLVVAKSDFAHNHLAVQFANHSVQRAYYAIVHGTFATRRGVVNAPIGRDPANRKKMAVVDRNARQAITTYRVLAEYGDYTLLRLELKTGRTHQIRVHLSYIGHPVVGDKLYGMKSDMDERYTGQLLHAYTLGFIHPGNGRLIMFESQMPDYMSDFISAMPIA
jgi:23S rRNA pseudouridine1911/1915/1917 synthase